MTVPRSYVEIQPPPALRSMVECIWTRRPSSSGVLPPSHRVLPDGCADLLLELAPTTTSGGRAARSPLEIDAAYFVGAMTRPIVVRQVRPRWFVGVRCRRGAARTLLGVPASELTDQRADLGALWPDGDALLAGLRAAIAEWAAPDENTPQAGPLAPVAPLVGTLWRVLQDRLGRQTPPPEDLRCALSRIDASGGTIRVDGLCGELGFTRQHLARRFATHVGVTPKTYTRIVRLHRVIERARAETAPNWARLAHELGYSDQAHLTSDFTGLVGVPPTQWRDGV